MDTWVWIVIAAVVVILLIVAIAAWARSRRRRGLHERFGSEYDRTVDSADSRRKAERDLRQREAEHEQLDIRPLSEAARERYEEQWKDVQMRFVDRPQVAVADADDMLTQVMRERGYPVDDFESKSRLVSVDHPDVVENYRNGHRIYTKTVEGSVSTEELRQAVVSYRALFEELVQDNGHSRDRENGGRRDEFASERRDDDDADRGRRDSDDDGGSRNYDDDAERRRSNEGARERPAN
jgi:hypothetical protein